MQTQQRSRVAFYVRALLPVLFGLLPWLGLQYDRALGGRHGEVTLRPMPVPELAAPSTAAPQLPGIQAATPPARFFVLPWFVLSAGPLLKLQPQVIHLPRHLVLFGRLSMDGG